MAIRCNSDGTSNPLGQYVKVEQNDTLQTIATTYGTIPYSQLVILNGLLSAESIVVGQIIRILWGSDPVSPPPTIINNTNKPIIEQFGLQANSENTVYISWRWHKPYTQSFRVLWEYFTGDNIIFVGSDSNLSGNERQSLYQIPNNAIFVKCTILPISETYALNDVQTNHWVAEWSTERQYWKRDTPPLIPETPEVSIVANRLSATLNNIASDVNANDIEFEVVKNDTIIFNKGRVPIFTSSAKYSCPVSIGGGYKVRARSVRGSIVSGWSAYSTAVQTIPDKPEGLYAQAIGQTSLAIVWTEVVNADTYNIQYATELYMFDGSDQLQEINGLEGSQYIKSGLTSGTQYFFRIAAINQNGSSAWSDVISCTLGSTPASPTTWSDSTTVVLGDTANLYWRHNASDNSAETSAEISLIVNNGTETKIMIPKVDNEDSVYTLATLLYSDGAKVYWKVRTAGITEEYGDWSISRVIEVWQQPTLSLQVLDENNLPTTTVHKYPLKIKGITGPNTQKPILYNVTIVSNTDYVLYDNTASSVSVKQGDVIYSKLIETSTNLQLSINVNDITLYNNAEYTVSCEVVMNTGIKIVQNSSFVTSWEDNIDWPNADIGVSDNYSTLIKPYVEEAHVSSLQRLYYTNNISTTKPEYNTLGQRWTASFHRYDGDISSEPWLFRTCILDENIDEYVIPAGEWTFTHNVTTTEENSEGYVLTQVLLYKNGVETLLFQCETEHINNTEYEVVTTQSLQPEYIKPKGSKLLIKRFMGIKKETVAAIIYNTNNTVYVETPMYKQENILLENKLLSVYRMDSDSTFVEICKNVPNDNTYVIDPHPTLNTVKYRIVSIDTLTGATGWYDTSFVINCPFIVIQWDGQYESFKAPEPNTTFDSKWKSNTLILPYNINVSEKYDKRTELIEYVGRSHPVCYHGTQKGVSADWSTDVPANDMDTLNKLRQLANYKGDVYVREPSGTGYWCLIDVSFSKKYNELVIPVTLNIVRVEGGK